MQPHQIILLLIACVGIIALVVGIYVNSIVAPAIRTPQIGARGNKVD